LACGLRRHEAVALTLDHLQQREEHWAIVDLVGKGGHIRTVPVPDWVRTELGDWLAAAAPPLPRYAPATAVTIFVLEFCLRTSLLPESPISRFPELSTMTPAGPKNFEDSAVWPLPSKPLTDPRTVLMILVVRLTP